MLFRRKKASSEQGDEVEAEIKEKKKWLHRPASERTLLHVQYKQAHTDLVCCPSADTAFKYAAFMLDYAPAGLHLRDDS